MHFSTLTPLYMLCFTLLLHTIFAAESLFNTCSNSINYTSNGPYEKNLNKLFVSLSSKVTPTGFGLGSVGRYPNRVNGLALCRGDVKSRDCETCVVEASVDIWNLCPGYKAAIIWYDNCLLKYSNENFFGKIDNENKFYLYNIDIVSDPETFNKKTKELLDRLSIEAYQSKVLYATGQLELKGSKKLYGLVQCTRDLSSKDCKKCLDGAISELPSCCDGRKGGRVVGGSCNFRYELYPFVNT